MGQSHDENYDHIESSEVISRKLKIGIVLNLTIVIVQVIGGIITNSLGLLSDAGHNFTDLGALVLSLYAVGQSLKPASQRKTFGYHRAGVIAALANSAALILITIAIFWEAYKRVLEPQPIEGGLTFWIASIGLLANVGTAWILHSSSKDNINVRSAFLHMVGDALVSLGVMLTAIIIIFTGFFLADPIISIVIGLVIAYGAWQIADESIHILLEGTPHGISVDEVLKAMHEVKGVMDVHDLHIWTIGSNVNALSCHVLVKEMSLAKSAGILNELNSVLVHHFNISHTAIQMESSFCAENYLYCDLASHRVIPRDIHGHSH